MKKHIALAAGIAASLFFTSCGDKKAKLSLYNWSYYTPDSVIKQFEEEFNCKVELNLYTSNEEMYTKIVSGGAKSFDIVVPSQDYAEIMIQENMLQPINQEKLTNRGNINPKVLEKAVYDPDMKYCVPYYFGAAGIAVNKTKAINYERSWNIFADPQFKDHATMMDDMREVIGDALAYQGHNVNSVDDDELAQAKELINKKWKPNLVKFDASSFGKEFAEGNFWLCQGYAEVVFQEMPQEKWSDIDFFIPAEGGPCYLDSMCILKDAPHADLANEFINFIHRPEIYAQFLDFFNFPCYVNLPAEEFMKTKPVYKASQMDSCTLKMDLGKDLDKYNTIWQDIRFTE